MATLPFDIGFGAPKTKHRQNIPKIEKKERKEIKEVFGTPPPLNEAYFERNAIEDMELLFNSLDIKRQREWLSYKHIKISNIGNSYKKYTFINSDGHRRTLEEYFNQFGNFYGVYSIGAGIKEIARLFSPIIEYHYIYENAAEDIKNRPETGSEKLTIMKDGDSIHRLQNGDTIRLKDYLYNISCIFVGEFGGKCLDRGQILTIIRDIEPENREDEYKRRQ